MTDANKEGSGTTIACLRELLDKATPGPWAVEDTVPGRSLGREFVRVGPGPSQWFQTGNDDDAALIAALRNAAPDLLRVVEAVANCYPCDPGGCECCFCGGLIHRHTDGCEWVLARKLMGAR